MEKQTFSNGIIWIIVSLVVVLGIVFWLGKDQASVSVTEMTPVAVSEAQGVIAQPTGQLTAVETKYDFGTISMKDALVNREFTVTNSTASDILISTIVTSCMCTTAYIVDAEGSFRGPFGMPGHGGTVPPANEIIKAGESTVIRVVYDPNAHGPAGVGPFVRQITVTDSTGKAVQFEIRGNVRP